MKIAFIGCSYSQVSDPNQGKNNWTYQLYQKYQKHQYINYSKGGVGIDYQQWCLYDAKLQNVDVVFLTRSHPGRSALVIDKYNQETQIDFFTSYSIEKNFVQRDVNLPYVWTSARSIGSTNTDTNSILKDFTEKLKQIHSASINKWYMDQEWYLASPDLYNFKHFFVLDFSKKKASNPKFKCVSNIQHNTVWNLIDPQKHCLSETDDHWNYVGNQQVLNNYILTESIRNILT